MGKHTAPQGFAQLVGSERNTPTNARHIGPANPQERIEVSVYLRDPSASSLADELSTTTQPGFRMTREEYAAKHSASSEDLASIETFAHAHQLTIVETNPLARKVVLAGTVNTLKTAFATDLQHYEIEGNTFRGRTGPLAVPSELEQVITGVFGLDNRPQARTHMRIRPEAQANATTYTPVQVAKLYNFPTNVTGSGQCIALIELGGGYNQSDISTYFQQLGITAPQVTSVSVDGGQNSPTGNANSADGEVGLDIEVAGAIAPEARIAVYFAPNTDQGFLDAITQATHDTANSPTIISISWGGPEASWTTQAMQTMDQAIQAATALGITVLVAAGDNGSSDGETDGQAHVDFPASSTYALGCGGTRLSSSSEVVWNDGASGGATGGGVSDVFPLPTWQENAGVPASVNNQHVGRGVPDVAGDADPQTGYQVYVDGQSFPVGGTSAVAPLWAGLLALINQQRGSSVGYINPFLYQNYQQLSQNKALRDVTSGNNGSYSAKAGWDACTGLGTPDGSLLLNALASTQTSSATAQD
jgi:kumamolisin